MLRLGDEIISVDQEISVEEIAEKRLSFIPDKDWFGTTELIWRAGNGYEFSEALGTLSLEVTPVNDPPGANDLQLTVEAGKTLEVQLKATDVDNSTDELTYELLSFPAKGEIVDLDAKSESLRT